MCVKYRKKVLTGELDARLKELASQVARDFLIDIIEQETDMDHIHILFSSRPSIAVSRFINSLKSVTSRRLRKEFPSVKKNTYGEGYSGLHLISWPRPGK